MAALEEKRFVSSLSKEQIASLHRLFSFNFESLTLDLDQVSILSEEPVIESWYVIFGGENRLASVDRWAALANRTHEEDASLDLKLLTQLENVLWSHPNVLSLARPIEPIRLFSQRASERGKRQYVVTSRSGHLKESTLTLMAKHYPWIERRHVYIRDSQNLNFVEGHHFKGKTIGALSPDYHFEDSPESVESVLRQTATTTVILFPRVKERGLFKGNQRVIEFTGFDLWFRLAGLYENYS